MPAEGRPLPAQPVIFENQSDAQFSFTSGTVPEERCSLPPAPLLFGSQSGAHRALDSDTQPEEESLEKMVADMEAELAKSPASSANRHVSHDPNYGLDMTFGLDTGLTPAIPNFGQNLNFNQYPHPSVPGSDHSLPYFAQDSNIRYTGLPHPSDSQDPSPSSGFDIAQDPVLHGPVAQDSSFEQKLNFPLDPTFDLANEHSYHQSLAASNLPPDSSTTQYPDPNVPDSTRSLPYIIQDSSIRDSELRDPSFSQGCSVIPDLGIAQDSVAQDPRFDPKLDLPLDPRFDLANEHSDCPPFSASTLPPDPSTTQYSDPNVRDDTRSLPYFIQRDPKLPCSSFSRDYSITPGFGTAQDPAAEDPNFDQNLNFPLDPSLDLSSDSSATCTIPLDPIATQYPDPNFVDTRRSLPHSTEDYSNRDPVLPRTAFPQGPESTVDSSFVPNLSDLNVVQIPIAHDSNLQQESGFPLDPKIGLANEPDNSKPFAECILPTATSVTQYSDPNDHNHACSLSYSVKDSNMRDSELPPPNTSQDLMSAVDPGFITNFDVAQDPSSHQQPGFTLDPYLGPTNYKPNAISNAPPPPPPSQVPNVPDPASLMPTFAPDPNVRDPELLPPNNPKVLTSTIDSRILPNLNVARDLVIQGSNFQQKHRFPNLGYANEHGKSKSIAVFDVPKALHLTQDLNVQSSSAQDPELPLSQELKSAVDPNFLSNLNVARDIVAPSSRLQRGPSFPLTPNSDLANGRGKLKQVAAFNESSALKALATNASDQDLAPDIDCTIFKQNHLIKAPSFPQTPSTASSQNVDRSKDSQFDIMDIEPDYKITPPGWKQNVLAKDKVDTLERGGLPEHSTDPYPVSTSSHISTPVTLLGSIRKLEASAKKPNLNRGFDEIQTQNISSKPSTENMTPKFDSKGSGVSEFKFKQVVEIVPELVVAHQEVKPEGDAKEKRSLIASSSSLLSKISTPATKTRKLSIPPTSIDHAVSSHPKPIGRTLQVHRETTDQREIKKLRAEIELKEKEISDRDEKIRQSTQELQDQGKKHMHLIGQLRGDMDKLRLENSMFEKANQSLARENSEIKEIQGKAKKDTELIRKLNCELNRIRKKQSALEKANEGLAKDHSDLRVNFDTLCKSNSILKEENCHLRASLDDLLPSSSELIEAKETIRAQKAEIDDSAQRIATLSACIDKISPELLWRTEELQEAEECVLHEQSVSKYYRDRCCLLWDKCNALESAGDSQETEFAKLELEEEQRHTKEIGALKFQISCLQVENKRLAQGRAEDVAGSANIKEADKVDEKVFSPYEDG